MPEMEQPTMDGSAIEDRTLADSIAGTVLAVPGVSRLEPSVSGGLRRLVRSAAGTDGVQLVRIGDRLEVTVDIAVVAVRTAAHTAAAVESAVAELLQTHHVGPVAVTVRVLSVTTV